MKAGMLLAGLSYLLAIFGNILSAGFFFYGIYIIFAKNFSSGLVLIGASVLTLIVTKIISNGLMLLGAVLSKKAINLEK